LSGKSAAPETDAARVAPAPAWPLEATLEQVEKQHMLRVLGATGGNKSEAARRLGIARKTMERKLRSWPDSA
jgi:DNA-binding NtrC family response regulator